MEATVLKKRSGHYTNGVPRFEYAIVSDEDEKQRLFEIGYYKAKGKEVQDVLQKLNADGATREEE